MFSNIKNYCKLNKNKKYKIILIISLLWFTLLILFLYFFELKLLILKIINENSIDTIQLLLADGFFLTFIIMYMIRYILKKKETEKEKKISILYIIIIIPLFIWIYYKLYILNIDIYLLDDYLKITPLINIIKVIILITAWIIFTQIYVNLEKSSINNSETCLIMLLSIFGMFILIMSNHLFIMYLSLELLSICLYILSSINRYSTKSIEAGIKYFIYGAYASTILLIGISITYWLIGTLYINDILIHDKYFELINKGVLIKDFGYGCIIIGFLFKLAIFPFQWWIDDVYEGTADIITFFFVIVPKIAIAIKFFELLSILISVEVNIIINLIIFICSICSIMFGSIIGLYQKKLKKLIAYSSITNFGFILIPWSLNIKNALTISIFFLTIYIITTILFLSLYMIYKKTNITDIVNLKKWNIYFLTIITISLLSLSGIPPLLGFYGKLFLIKEIIGTGNIILIIIILKCSIINTVFYIRLIRFILFTSEEKSNITESKKITELSAYIIILIAYITIYGFLLHIYIYLFIKTFI